MTLAPAHPAVSPALSPEHHRIRGYAAAAAATPLKLRLLRLLLLGDVAPAFGAQEWLQRLTIRHSETCVATICHSVIELLHNTVNFTIQ